MKLVFSTESGVRYLDTGAMDSAFDTRPSACRPEKAEKARKMVAEGLIFTVAENGVWNAHDEKRTVHVQSYEKLGYHSGTRGFFEAFVRAGGKVEFYGYRGIRGSLVRWEE